MLVDGMHDRVADGGLTSTERGVNVFIYWVVTVQ